LKGNECEQYATWGLAVAPPNFLRLAITPTATKNDFPSPRRSNDDGTGQTTVPPDTHASVVFQNPGLLSVPEWIYRERKVLTPNDESNSNARKQTLGKSQCSLSLSIRKLACHKNHRVTWQSVASTQTLFLSGVLFLIQLTVKWNVKSNEKFVYDWKGIFLVPRKSIRCSEEIDPPIIPSTLFGSCDVLGHSYQLDSVGSLAG
jgi:hypothetical protein